MSDTVIENAIMYFKQKFNCAESTLMAISEHWNLKSDNIPRIASGFGAGIARRGEVCGALTGAIMALGLKYGRETPDEEKKNALYIKVEEIYNSFQNEFGTILCRELTDCDMTTPEGLSKFASMDMHNTLCPKFVEFTVKSVFSIKE